MIGAAPWPQQLTWTPGPHRSQPGQCHSAPEGIQAAASRREGCRNDAAWRLLLQPAHKRLAGGQGAGCTQQGGGDPHIAGAGNKAADGMRLAEQHTVLQMLPAPVLAFSSDGGCSCLLLHRPCSSRSGAGSCKAAEKLALPRQLCRASRVGEGCCFASRGRVSQAAMKAAATAGSLAEPSAQQQRSCRSSSSTCPGQEGRPLRSMPHPAWQQRRRAQGTGWPLRCCHMPRPWAAVASRRTEPGVSRGHARGYALRWTQLDGS